MIGLCGQSSLDFFEMISDFSGDCKCAITGCLQKIVTASHTEKKRFHVRACAGVNKITVIQTDTPLKKTDKTVLAEGLLCSLCLCARRCRCTGSVSFPTEC